MSKRLTVWAAAGLSVLTLMGCTGQAGPQAADGTSDGQPDTVAETTGEDSSATAGQTSGPVTINYYGRPNSNDVESTIVAEFEKQYPDIKVNYVELPDSSNDRLKTINTVLQAGDSSIDVFAGDVVWPPIFASAGWVIPLDDYVTKEELDGYLAGPLSAFQMQGATYGLPFMADSGALYYRADLLDKYNKPVPATWTELIETSREITMAEANAELSGFSSYWMQNESLTCAMLEMYWPLGASIVGMDGKSTVDEEKMTEALAMMKAMIDEEIAVKGIETFSTAESRNTVTAGNALFARDWLSGYAVFNNTESSQVAGQMAIAPLPGSGTLGGWGVMVSAYSANQEAAVTFARFRAGYESQKIAMDLANIVPTIKSMYEAGSVPENADYLPEFLSVLEVARPRPQTPFYAEISGNMQVEIHSVVSGMSSPQDGAAAIKRKVGAVLN